MLILFEQSSEISHLKNSLNKLMNNQSIQSIMILLGDKNEYDKNELDIFFTQINKTIWGGIFPQLIYEKVNYETGFILIGFEEQINVHTITNLSSTKIDYFDYFEEKFADAPNFNTLNIFIDGFSKRISALVDGVFNLFGNSKNVLGGGAGSLSMKQAPCIICNNGLLEDSAVFAFLNYKSGIGVAHGWEKIKGPFRVTESDRNEIISIDWQPAFSIYQKEVEAHSGLKFDQDNFFSIAKAYPFGIKKLDAENIVRDPILKTDSDSLICVGEVPVGSFVDILTGNTKSLINASKTAFQRASNNYAGNNNKNCVFIIDCISRVLFLEDRIKDELTETYDDEIAHVGILTLGEIANSGKDYIEFYNKTIVVGIL